MPGHVLFLHTLPEALWELRAAPLVSALRSLSPLEVVVAHARDTQLRIEDGHAVLDVDHRSIPTQDLAGVITRNFRAHGQVLAAALEQLGVNVTNSPTATVVANSKFRTAAALTRAGIAVPAQSLVSPATHDVEAAVALHADELGQVVLKRDNGARGEFVFLLDQTGVADTFERSGDADAWLVQEFQTDAAGTDLRVVVAGGRVVAALRRENHDGDFRAHVGERTRYLIDIDPKIADIAIRATDAVGLDVSGVDILETGAGPLVAEVNACPVLTPLLELGGPALIEEIAAAKLASIGIR